MRLIRLGDVTSTVGADVRAALASWGRGDSVVGGVALLGCTPPDCSEPVDAIVVLPRGLLVIVSVDLPDPAMRLDAPVAAQWKADGWPLVRQDGAVNPASEAMQSAGAVAARLQSQRVEPLPIGTVIAVGPYVARVSQPTNDLARGIRVLHPEPMTLLTAARELAVYERRCPVHKANAVLAALAPDHPPLTVADLVSEGFDEATTGPDMAAASTVLIPRVPAQVQPHQPGPARTVRHLGWLPTSAALLVGLLLVVGVVVAIVASTNGSSNPTAGSAPSVTSAQQTGPVIDGVTYMPKGTIKDTDCAARASGDMRAWLQTNKCTGLLRTRYETTIGTDAAAVLVADLSFADAATAEKFREVAATPGTGSISDPGVDGTQWPDGKRPFFDSAAYEAKTRDAQVRIVQVVWLDRPSTPEDPALMRAATRSLNLPTL